MRASKSIFLSLLFLALGFSFVAAQETAKTCTVVDVAGGSYYDRLWLFTVEETTDGFDNGWDGYKFLKTICSAPQIYAVTVSGNLQVSTVSNVNDKVIGFIPGDATDYKLTFSHTKLSDSYQQLYLIDRLTGKITDVYAEGSVYNFSAKKGDIIERFVLVTSSNQQDAFGEVKNDDNKAKNVKVYSVGSKLYVDNHNNQKAVLKIVNVRNGKIEKCLDVDSESFMSFDTNLELGAYIVCVVLDNAMANTTVILQ